MDDSPGGKIDGTIPIGRNRSEPPAAGVIFDMDGVLIDSFAAHFESWRQVCGRRDREYTREQFVAGFGRTSREVIADQWQGESLSEAEIRGLDEEKEAAFRELLEADFPAMEGAVTLIRALRGAGFRIAIGSSGPPPNVQLAIRRLGIAELLSAVVTGADVKRGKPDPQVFLLAAERLEVPPARCVVVEDAPVGIEAAHRAGMKCIGLASTGRTVEQLKAAERVVMTLRALQPADFKTLIHQGG